MSNTNAIFFGYDRQLANKLIKVIVNYSTKQEKIHFSEKNINLLSDEEDIHDDLKENIIVYESERPFSLRLIEITNEKPESKHKFFENQKDSQENNIFICVFSAEYLLKEQDEISLKKIYTLFEEVGLNNFFCIIERSKLNNDDEDKEELKASDNYIRGKLGYLFKNKQNSFDERKYESRVFFVDLERAFEICQQEEDFLSEELNKPNFLTFITELKSCWEIESREEETNKSPKPKESEESKPTPEEKSEFSPSAIEDYWEEIPEKEKQEIDSSGYEVIKKKSNTIADVLEDVSVLIGKRQDESVNLKVGGTFKQPGINLVEKAKELAALAQDIRQGIFKLIVLGAFSNGKSTLINALLGEKILKAKALPTTSIVTMLVHGNSTDVVIKYKDNKIPSRMDFDSFFKEYTLTIEDRKNIEDRGYVDRFKNIKYAQIERNYRLLENGVRLIDSPGLEDEESRTDLVLDYLNECQAVILVLNAQQLLTQSEREFIEEELADTNFSNLFFVVNKINLVPEDEVEELNEYLRNQIKHHFLDLNGIFDADYYQRRVFFVNAQGALEGRTGSNNDNLLEGSNITKLENDLEHFLTSDAKNTAVFEVTLKRLSEVLIKTRDSINKQKEVSAKPLEELEANRVKAEELLEKLENEKEKIEQIIVSYGKSISEKIFSSLILYMDELEKTWQTDSQNFELKGLNIGEILKTVVSKKAKEKISTIIQEEIEQYFKKKLTQWAKNKVPTIIQEDVKEMMSTVEKQVEHFQFQLIQIDNLFSTGKLLNNLELDTEKGKVNKTVQGLLSLVLVDVSGFTGTLMGKGSWIDFISRLLIDKIIKAIIIGLFFGAFNIAITPFWALIAYAMTELFHMGMQQAGFKKNLLKSLGEKLYGNGNLLKEMSKQHDTICKNVQEQFAQQSKILTLNLQVQINDKRTQQEDILKQKRQQSFSVEQEKIRLFTIDSKLIELGDIASRVIGKSLEE